MPISKRNAIPRQARSWLAAGLALLVAGLASPSSGALERDGLVVEPEAQGVVVSNLAAGESVYLVGVARELHDEVTRITHWQQVEADSDLDGVVHFDLGLHPAPSSSWIAVELASGRSGLCGGVPDFVPVAIPELSKLPALTELTTLDLTRSDAVVFIVRPGVDAWILELGDGGDADADGSANGLIAVPFDQSRPFADGKASAPSQLEVRDVVAVIDPSTLAAGVVQIACSSDCPKSF